MRLTPVANMLAFGRHTALRTTTRLSSMSLRMMSAAAPSVKVGHPIPIRRRASFAFAFASQLLECFVCCCLYY